MKHLWASFGVALVMATLSGCVNDPPTNNPSEGDSQVPSMDQGMMANDMAQTSNRDAAAADANSNMQPDTAVDMNSPTPPDATPRVDASIVPPQVCGDGAPQGTEICDDGGDTMDCDGDCTRPSCGDGYHNPAAGEACDDGGDSATCNADCTLVRCGDGIVNEAAGETCDDSNVEHLDDCSPTCQAVDVSPCDAECVLDNTYSVFEPTARQSFHEFGSEVPYLFGTSVAHNDRWTLVAQDALGGRGIPVREGFFIFGRTPESSWDLGSFIGIERERPIQFGRHAALAEDMVIVGAYNDRENDIFPGAAYVFEFVNDQWRQTARLLADPPVNFSQFGRNITIHLPYVFVSAINQATNGGSGIISVFLRDENGDWRQIQRLSPQAGDGGGQFGFGLNTDGQRLIAGINGTEIVPNNKPAAYIYERQENGQWARSAILRMPPGIGWMSGGLNVAIHADTALVSGYEQAANGDFSGVVMAYHRDAQGEWSHEATLSSEDPRPGEDFGVSIALGHGFAVIGARININRAEGVGTAAVYERLADGSWIHRSDIFSPAAQPAAAFGGSVSVSNGQALIGAPGRVIMEEMPNAGRAYLFDLNRPICHRDGACFCRPGFGGDTCADRLP